MRYRIIVFKNNITWYKNDLSHRLYGPAYENRNGSKAWYQNGKCHREDAPASEYVNGERYWWIKGIFKW